MPKNRTEGPGTAPIVVAGLGNPGPRYAGSRHNAGYLAVDMLAIEPPLRFRRRLFSSYYAARVETPSPGRPIVAVRYDGFMNHSGRMAPGLLRRFRIDPQDLIVVVDNMDLPPGACRLKRGGGDAGHNGLKSLVRNLGSGDFLRLYIGVGRPGRGTSVVDHVLGKPGAEDGKAITEACGRAADAIRALASRPFESVAEEFNRRGS